MFGSMTPPPPRDLFWHPTRTARPARHARSLVSIWAQGRQRFTPWAYPRLRALATMRFAIGIFLVGASALVLSVGHSRWAALPLAGAVLHFSIAYLDISVVHRAAPRT
jgi:hypothetical protein